MKTVVTSAIVAVIVSLVVLYLDEALETDDDDRGNVATTVSSGAADDSTDGLRIHFTDALPEDTWVDGSRQAGGDRRTLTDAANSICYLTKIEIKGIQGPEDTNSCVIGLDDFTGHWELIATVEEGGQSSVRCNARCLEWE